MSASFAGAIVIVALTLIAAITAAAETALTRIGRARAEGLAHDDANNSGPLLAVLDDRETSLVPLLFLRVGCQAGVVAIVVSLIDGRTSAAGIAGVVVAVVVGLYVLAEAVPRIWALQHIDAAAMRSARLLRTILRIAPLRWLTRILTGVANVVLPGPSGAPVISEDELIAMTEAAAAIDAIDDEERDLIESVFALGDTIVREAMVPRTDMITAMSTATLTEVLDIADESGLSRVPILGKGIDDVIGVALVKDLSRAERAGNGLIEVGSLMRPPRFIPETKHADDLLREMQSAQHHLAIVIDEYGGTAGLVTLEDLVEELVGEIVDESDNEEPLYQPLADGNLRVHGRMPVDQLENLIDAELDDGESDTVGGLIFNTLGHVPEVGESIKTREMTLHVERMEGRRITGVRLTRPDHG